MLLVSLKSASGASKLSRSFSDDCARRFFPRAVGASSRAINQFCSRTWQNLAGPRSPTLHGADVSLSPARFWVAQLRWI